MNYKSITGRIAATTVALFVSTGVANAADLFERGSLKDAPVERERPELSANVALTSDYIFRGISQTQEGPAIQGGFDASYKMFYAGVWASNLDFGGDDNGNDIANIEIDLYAGIKHKFGAIEADLGVIYYAYPGAEDPTAELDYVEIKFGASGNLTDKIGLSGTLYYSPDYTGETGETLTYEGGVSIALGTYGRFSPTFTGTVGYVDFLESANEALSYTYWNAGVEVGFAEKFTLDLRYWDTDIDDDHASGLADESEERFVATVSASF
ncbi:TorF family putative porin [Hyphomicrobiales bacterium 4NK60-0047b]|jgi:uncharacterized protein (TIGR02001 family)